MASLRVPQAAEEGLVSLSKLSEREMALLKQTLTHAAPTLAIQDLIRRIASAVPLPGDDAAKIAFVLASLYSVKVEREATSEKIGEELLDALRRTGNKDLQLSQPQADRFRTDIEELLSLDGSLGVTARALAVMREHERVWQSGRVLTDLRPVFGPDPGETPTAAIITHNLRIAYRDSGQLKEFFVALDADNLVQLQRALERAKKKEESLRKLAGKVGISCLRAKPE